MDGIVGMAFPGMSVEKETLFDLAWSQQHAAKQHSNSMLLPVFSFALYSGINAEKSHITFGSIDHSLYHPDQMFTSKIYGTRYWEIHAISIQVNGEPIEHGCTIEKPCKIAGLCCVFTE